MKMHRAIIASVLLASLPVAAQDKACSKADAAKAEKAVDMVTSFAQLQKAWQDWRHCDSGTVAETFSESLFRLLVDWKGVETLASGAQSSPQYKQWVLERVKAGSKEDRAALFSRAKTGCSSKLDAFCAELIEASSDAPPPKAMAPVPASPAPALAPAPAPPK
jgi:hypothetical protein